MKNLELPKYDSDWRRDKDGNLIDMSQKGSKSESSKETSSGDGTAEENSEELSTDDGEGFNFFNETEKE